MCKCPASQTPNCAHPQVHSLRTTLLGEYIHKQHPTVTRNSLKSSPGCNQSEGLKLLSKWVGNPNPLANGQGQGGEGKGLKQPLKRGWQGPRWLPRENWPHQVDNRLPGWQSPARTAREGQFKGEIWGLWAWNSRENLSGNPRLGFLGF